MKHLTQIVRQGVFAVIMTSGLLRAASDDVSFLKDVAPILLTRCSGCHGPTKSEGDFRLHTFEYLNVAGTSDIEPVAAGIPEESELFSRIIEIDDSIRMPQEDDRLSPDEIAIIRQWIESGARYDGTDPAATLRSQMPPRNHPAAPDRYRQPVPVYAVAFSPDGRLLAASGYREMTLWDPETGALVGRIGGLPQRIHAIAWHPDETRLFVGGGIPGEYGELCEVSIDSGTRSRVFGTFGDVVLSVSLSHDGQRILGTSADSGVRCYDAGSGDQLWSSPLHADWVMASTFSADDQLAVTGGRDSTIKILQADSGQLFATYKGHQKNLGPERGRFAIHAIVTHDEGPLMFSAGAGRAIRVWEPEKAKAEDGDAGDMEIRFYRKGHTRYVRHKSERPVFRMVARGNDLFVATGDGFVKQFAVDSLEEVREYAGPDGWVFALDVHEESQRIAAGAFNGDIHVWNTATGEIATAFPAAPNGPLTQRD